MLAVHTPSAPVTAAGRYCTLALAAATIFGRGLLPRSLAPAELLRDGAPHQGEAIGWGTHGLPGRPFASWSVLAGASRAPKAAPVESAC